MLRVGMATVAKQSYIQFMVFDENFKGPISTVSLN